MEKFNLNWHTYNDHLREIMQHLMQSNAYTDVTLVCDDKTRFKAHKFVLSACSPIFESIINDLPHKDSVIFLRGVLGQEMRSILQFMYKGQATLYQDRMKDFLDTAKILEIKEISKDIEVTADSLQDTEDAKKQYNNGNLHHTEANENEINIIEEIDYLNTKLLKSNEAGQFSCEKCDKQFSRKFNLDIHIKAVHEGIKFPCDMCSHAASSKSNLYKHKKIKH